MHMYEHTLLHISEVYMYELCNYIMSFTKKTRKPSPSPSIAFNRKLFDLGTHHQNILKPQEVSPPVIASWFIDVFFALTIRMS